MYGARLHFASGRRVIEGVGEIVQFIRCTSGTSSTLNFVNTRATSRAVELLICAGDFKGVRSAYNLHCVACPQKYRDMRTFHHYHGHVLCAPMPMLTLLVEGNHDESRYLHELPFGGLVLRNIHVIHNGGADCFVALCIEGLSGAHVLCSFRRTHMSIRLRLCTSCTRSILVDWRHGILL